MKTTDFVIANCSQIATCAGRRTPKRSVDLQDIGLIENGWLAGRDGLIVFAGSEQEFKSSVSPDSQAVWIDGSGLVALPGFVDPHTHLPFAGNRVEEFRLRLQGWTYQQLAAAGMGIQSTVRNTRQIAKNELVELCQKRLDRMLINGTTTIEAKSGYGLNLEDEIKQLEAIKEANQTHPVDIIPTFMGAHQVPPEFQNNRQGYIDFLIREVIPEVKKRGLAEFFDIFCEQDVFSLEETEILLKAARTAGFKLKVHADEFSNLGGTELAAKYGAASAEHLINISAAGINALAGSSTAAILLPGVSFFLMMDKYAPARELIDQGAILALATDFNPGSSMICSMQFILQLAVFKLKLNLEEAINACTTNAAYAIGREKEIGSLEPGKKMDVILCDIPDYISLAYHPGSNHVRHVIKSGRLVVKDGVLQI